jgi:hypothetical protein
MGIRCSYTLMSPEALERFQARETRTEDVKEERFSIDKGWYGFHIAFRKFGPPLSLAVNGDQQPYDFPPDIDRWLNGTFPSDFYIATVSPPLVKRIDEKLKMLNELQIDSICEESEVSPRDYFTSNFNSLRDAFANAARRSWALLVTVC